MSQLIRIIILIWMALVAIDIAAGDAQPLHIPIQSPEQDKAFSEFNHHIAGYFLLAIGIMAILSRSSKRLSFLRYVWPFLFVLPGLYLAFMSDPDVWPMGNQGLFNALLSNPEARQHKIYSLLLIAFGVLEFQRSRSRLRPFLSTWSFPLLAAFGAILLFFHEHGSAHDEMAHAMNGMHSAGHTLTDSMKKIQTEHFWFSTVGFFIIFFKLIFDGNFWKRPFVPYLWPACLSLLGVLLLAYSE